MGDNKRVFDIKPSGKLPEKAEPIRQPELPRAAASLSSNPPAGGGKLVPLFLGAALLAGGALSYFLIPAKVTIEIWPEQKITKEDVITAVSASTNSAIQGQTIEKETTISQTFKSTGAEFKSSKAQGVIRVYNNYSATPQALIASTRFVSNEGKLFRTPTRVVIPGSPGFVDVQVVADQPGEDYNIEPSTFSIPGFAGTPKYTAFYGKSFEPMKGGASKQVPQVSQSDLDKAKEILTQKAVEQAKTLLKDFVASENFVLFDGAVTAQLAEFNPQTKLGEDLENFSAEGKAKARALVFKESDLKNFAVNYIKSKIAPEDKLIDAFFKAEYVLESINLAKPEIILKLSISASSYAIPEDAEIKEMVKNKSVESITQALKGFPRIDKAKVELWPFWVKSAPDNLERIEVVLHF